MLAHENTEFTTHPETPMSTGQEALTVGSDAELNMAHIDLADAPESFSSGTHSSSPCSDQYQNSIAISSEPTSYSMESAWDSVVTLSSPDTTKVIEPSLTYQQKSPFLYGPGFANIDSVIHNDFDLYLDLMAEHLPAVPLPATDDDFGFDPPGWLSEPGTRDGVSSSGVCADIVSDVEHRGFQSICTRPPPLATVMESTRSVNDSGCKFSPIKNPQEVEQSAQAIPSAQRTCIRPRRPGRPRKTAHGLRDIFPSDVDKRRRSLQKNRIAATKCRKKKKAEVEALKDASAASMTENSLLKHQAKKLREEVQDLRDELFAHMFRGNKCCEQGKWTMALGAVGSAKTSAN
jgi:hypothetical protein